MAAAPPLNVSPFFTAERLQRLREAEALLASHHYSAALEAYRALLAEYKDLLLSPQLAALIVRSATCHSELGQFSRAVSVFDAARRVLLLFGDPASRREMAWCELAAGTNSHRMGRTSDAIIAFKKALSIYSELGCRKGKILFHYA